MTTNSAKELLDLDRIIKSINSIDVPDDLASVLDGVDFNKADAATLRYFLDLIDTYERKLESAGTRKWFVPGTPFGIENCPRHSAFFRAGKDYNERIFLAGNRVGKSVSGALELACHATGDYPEWWKGRRFDRPIRAWAAGADAKSTRDTAQKELLGPIGAWGTGMLPKDCLGKYWALAGVPQGVDLIQVRHVSGGWSTIGFKNYAQELSAFYGTAMDCIWLDEECPQNIYNECLYRTMTTNGLIYVTFTPLAGITPFVVGFCRNADFVAGAKPITIPDKLIQTEDGEDSRFAGKRAYKAVIQAGWDHAAWLDENQKERMLADTPPNLRNARKNGEPALGSGSVYPVSLEEVSCEPFEIPHDWKRLYALDVGWRRTAALWGALDPIRDILYIVDEHYVAEQPPAVHAMAIRQRGEWQYGVIDPASRARSQVDGQNLMQQYKDLGLKLFPAKNEVEGGILNVWNRLTTGKLKFFNNLPNLRSEYMTYRRDEKGRVIKEDDHLMDGLRYLVNNMIRAQARYSSKSGGTQHAGTKRYNI